MLHGCVVKPIRPTTAGGHHALLRVERISSPPPGFVSALQVAHVGQPAIGQQLRHTGA